jgi:glucokinase
MTNAIGIDIGGTKIAGGVVTPTGELLHQVEKPTDPQSPDSILGTIAEIVSELPTENTQSTIGVAVAAFLDSQREKIYFSPNIVWEDYPLAKRLEDTLSRPVVIENDANAAGWAEYRFGAAVDSKSMMMLTMGTGVGGAVVDHGRLLVGGFGSAGELGHIIIRPGGLDCGCGNRGCLEQYASGTALMRDARLALGNPELTTHQLTMLLEAGDQKAMEVFREVCDAMGLGIASLVAVTDPDTVVIGGGVARAGSVLATLITESFESHYGSTTRRPTAQIVVATLGNTAGMIGAADLARERRGIGT